MNSLEVKSQRHATGPPPSPPIYYAYGTAATVNDFGSYFLRHSWTSLVNVYFLPITETYSDAHSFHYFLSKTAQPLRVDIYIILLAYFKFFLAPSLTSFPQEPCFSGIKVAFVEKINLDQ